MKEAGRNRICSLGCALAVTIWSTHDFETQRLAIVEVLSHGAEATVQRAYTWPFYGEYWFPATSDTNYCTTFRIVPLLKHRGGMQVFYNDRIFSGIATHPLHDPAAPQEALLGKDWCYFVSRGGSEPPLSVYFKVYRKGACPKDSAALIREWMKLGHYRNVRGGT